MMDGAYVYQGIMLITATGVVSYLDDVQLNTNPYSDIDQYNYTTFGYYVHQLNVVHPEHVFSLGSSILLFYHNLPADSSSRQHMCWH